MCVLRVCGSDADRVYAGCLEGLPKDGDVEGLRGVGEAGGVLVGWVERGTWKGVCHIQRLCCRVLGTQSGAGLL